VGNGGFESISSNVAKRANGGLEVKDVYGPLMRNLYRPQGQ
jgi:hypothetical protein